MADPSKDDMEALEKGARLESIIKYPFRDRDLRNRAITRKAWANDRKSEGHKDNESLATLGDAVIDVIVLSQLISQEDSKGIITQEKIERVKGENLTRLAKNIGLKDCIRLGGCEGEKDEWNNGKAPGECLEAVIGAVYVDSRDCSEDAIGICTTILKVIGLI